MKILRTSVPMWKNVHFKEGKFEPFFVLKEEDSGLVTAYVGIVNVPNLFNDLQLRNRIANTVVRKGSPLTFRQASAFFNVPLNDYSMKG